MKFLDCIPGWIRKPLVGKDIREIRLRNDAVVRVNVGGKWWYCGNVGLTTNQSLAKKLDVLCDDIVRVACNNSIYAYEQMLAKGFFTLADGSRFGIAGVYGSGGVFQSYTSVCIRVPRCFVCATQDMLLSAKNGNLLVLGLPGKGKTTLLRDIAKSLSANCNVVVLDERGELSVQNELSCCDVLRWTSKDIGAEIAIRCLSPEYIVCDELSLEDQNWLSRACSSGVKIIASLHGNLATLQKMSAICGCFDSAIVCNDIGDYRTIKLHK